MNVEFVELDQANPISAPKASDVSLVGLTARIRLLEPGAGILIPRGDGWDSKFMLDLRNRIGTVLTRVRQSTGNRYISRTTPKGVEIWRMQ